MVHFPTLPSHAYVFSEGYPSITQGGFPHSEIAGSKPVCGSPRLFAAYHVLHRLLAPRHSPYTLSSLIITPDFLCTKPVFRTACALIGNYLLQDIQLSKIRRLPFRLQRDSAATEAATAVDLESGGEYRARTGDLLVAKQHSAS